MPTTRHTPEQIEKSRQLLLYHLFHPEAVRLYFTFQSKTKLHVYVVDRDGDIHDITRAVAVLLNRIQSDVSIVIRGGLSKPMMMDLIVEGLTDEFKPDKKFEREMLY